MKFMDVRTSLFGDGTRSSVRHCMYCGLSTREGKSCCTDHVHRLPYVQSLLDLIDGKEERDEAVIASGVTDEDIESGISVHELLQHLALNGPKTEERLCRDLNFKPKTVAAYAKGLSERGLVQIGRTARGSTVVKVTAAGLKHVGDMRPPQPAAGQFVDDVAIQPAGDPEPALRFAPEGWTDEDAGSEAHVHREEPAVREGLHDDRDHVETPVDPAGRAPLENAPLENAPSGADESPRDDHQATTPDSSEGGARLSNAEGGASEKEADMKGPAKTADRESGMKVRTWKVSSGELARSRAELDAALGELADACERAGDGSYLSHAISAQAEACVVAAATIRLLARAISSGGPKGRREAKPSTTKAKKPPKASDGSKATKPAKTKTKRVPADKGALGEVARWLRKVRTRSGLSQAAFGEKVGASYTQMWHWEKGNRAPGDEFLAKIEKLAGETAPTGAR